MKSIIFKKKSKNIGFEAELSLIPNFAADISYVKWGMILLNEYQIYSLIFKEFQCLKNLNVLVNI